MLHKIFIFVFFAMIFSTFEIAAQTAAPPIEPGVSRELARWRAANYGNVRYKLNLTLEKQSPRLKGSIEISLDNRADRIVLDWRKIKGKEEFASVSNVQLNGSPAKFEEINEHLVFKENVKTGENVVKLDFTSPIATSGAGITRYVDKEDGAEYIYSLFVPSDASTTFPCFDQPDLKARFTLEITSPIDWKVVANSKLHSQTNKTSTMILGFEETQPISTYVFAFAAGDFRIVSRTFPNESFGIGGGSNDEETLKLLREEPKGFIYVRKSQFEKFKPHIKEVFRLNREAIKYLETYFDYKFPFPKYDLVLIPEFPFGGMEHAGATFLRESSIIFPSEPTANDYISRANLIFHEAAHQWFGDTVTMRWFDDLWLKEGFAEFMAYKTLEKVLPQYNAWKAFYERNKPLAYQTDSTRGTTAIYQEIPNLSAAKSAYGNIVYRKAPAFLRQAEFYLGDVMFQSAVQSFLKQNAYKNAEWQDLVNAFEKASGRNLKIWAETWVKRRGLPIIRFDGKSFTQQSSLADETIWEQKIQIRTFRVSKTEIFDDYNLLDFVNLKQKTQPFKLIEKTPFVNVVFPNYEDYGYGIFLLDEMSRNYVLASIQNEKDPFLRAMMWGALWDSVREAELDPRDYVELVVKNIGAERDELTIQTILGRVSIAMNYYLPEKQAAQLAPRLEKVLLERMTGAESAGERIVFYRAFLNLASTDDGRRILRDILNNKFEGIQFKLKTKDLFDITTKLLILGDPNAPVVLQYLAETEKTDEARRYAYAAGAGIATKEAKAKYFDDFLNDKEISESWIEAAFVPFNSVRHRDLTEPFLEKALSELPNLKRTRKIFFVNGWLAAFIGGQRDERALQTVNKFLADNPSLDRDLRLKVLETVDNLERAIKIRSKFAGKESKTETKISASQK